MIRFIILTVFIFLMLPSTAQELMKFSIETERQMLEKPVKIFLGGLSINNVEGSPVLYEITGGNERYLPGQIETGYNDVLYFILPVSKHSGIREFVLKMEEKPVLSESPDQIKVEKDHEHLNLHFKERPVLSYRHAIKYPPEGVNPINKRSGYIHPLLSPEGFMLTRIQPPDHYHHYAIWGPWTKTHIGDREVDFWNLAQGQGTVKFDEFLGETEGPVFSGFKVLQKHVDFGARGEDQVALYEILELKAWNTKESFRIIDYTTTLNCPLPDGILFDAYRYGGGLGFRATEKWDKNNCTVLTSEGKTRADADGSNARWCIIEGESDTESGRSGILFLSHLSNRMHPEPMRVWPENAAGGRGDMFFEFTPIRHESWKIQPHRDYTLKYRMIVFDGTMTEEMAEELWRNFVGKDVKIITDLDK